MLKEAGINVPEMDANAMRKSFSAVEPNGVGSTMQILSYAKLIYDVHDLYMFLAFWDQCCTPVCFGCQGGTLTRSMSTALW